MTDAKKIADGLSEIDHERLGDLISGHDNSLRVTGESGVAPLDCGGSNGSDHSYRLTKLVKMGLAEHRKRGCPWGKYPTRGYRGSKLYRPTDLGRQVHEIYRAGGEA